MSFLDHLVLRYNGSQVVASGQMAYPAAPPAIDYLVWTFSNQSPDTTLTSPRVWLTSDPSGVAASIAVPSSTAEPLGSVWSGDPQSLTYSTAAGYAVGIEAPTLTPQTCFSIVMRRSPFGVPIIRRGIETNVLHVDGTRG